jgi:hypothetical protein
MDWPLNSMVNSLLKCLYCRTIIRWSTSGVSVEQPEYLPYTGLVLLTQPQSFAGLVSGRHKSSIRIPDTVSNITARIVLSFSLRFLVSPAVGLLFQQIPSHQRCLTDLILPSSTRRILCGYLSMVRESSNRTDRFSPLQVLVRFYSHPILRQFGRSGMGKGQCSRPSNPWASTVAIAFRAVAIGDLDAGSVLAPELDGGNKNVPPSLTRKLLGYIVPKRFLRQPPPSASHSTASTSTSTSSSASSANTAKGGEGFIRRWLRKSGDTPDKQPAPPSPRQPARIPNTKHQSRNCNLDALSTRDYATRAPTQVNLPPSVYPLRPITHWLFRSPSKAIGKVQGPKLPLLRRYDLESASCWTLGGDGERTVNPLVQHNDIIPTAIAPLFCWSHVSDA